jgi:hypothetical protein
VGANPEDNLVDSLEDFFQESPLIGDCLKPRNAAGAIFEKEGETTFPDDDFFQSARLLVLTF